MKYLQDELKGKSAGLIPLRLPVNPDGIVIRPTNQLQDQHPDHLDDAVRPLFNMSVHGDYVVSNKITKDM